ncbi:hypothetical protein [Nocardiopsis dassonvillei]
MDDSPTCAAASALGPLELSLPFRLFGLCLRLRLVLSGGCPGGR